MKKIPLSKILSLILCFTLLNSNHHMKSSLQFHFLAVKKESLSTVIQSSSASLCALAALGSFWVGAQNVLDAASE